MTALTASAMWWAGGVTQLVERSKDDACRRIEIGLEDLEHGDPVWPDLKHTAFSSGRCVVCRFGQFDDVELFDFVRYSHWLFMLEGRICGDQSRCAVFVGVMPRDRHWGMSVVDSKLHSDPAGEATEDPVFDLAPFIPSILGARKNFPYLRRPVHGADTMELRRTYVQHALTLRVEIHTKGVRR